MSTEGQELDAEERRLLASAIAVIGDQAESDYVLKPMQHASEIRSRAVQQGVDAEALLAVLESDPIKEIAAAYDRHNSAANDLRKRHDRIANAGIWSTVVSMFLAAGLTTTVPATVGNWALVAIAVLAGFALAQRVLRSVLRRRAAGVASKTSKRCDESLKWLSESALLLAMLIFVAYLALWLGQEPWGRVAISSIVFLLLLVAWGAFNHLQSWKPQQHWYAERGAAELFRKRLFEDVLSANGQDKHGRLPLLPLKLEYFRRYQYQVQRNYFDERSREHDWIAKRAERLRPLFLIVPLGALLASCVMGVSAFGEQDAPPQALANLASGTSWLAIENVDGLLIMLAIATGALMAGLFASSLLDNSRRNADRYANTLAQIEDIVGDPEIGLAAARTAAIGGKARPVERLVEELHRVMSVELQEWVKLNEADKDLLRQRRRLPAG